MKECSTSMHRVSGKIIDIRVKFRIHPWPSFQCQSPRPSIHPQCLRVMLDGTIWNDPPMSTVPDDCAAQLTAKRGA